MNTPRRVLSILTTVAAVVATLAVVGSIVGHPVLLGFVETGSMSPTLDPGDGFVAVPAQLTADPEPGDVVTFRAERLHGGGLTTHRIVRETDRGYVTRGDANPFTDQAGEEPPVKDARIVAEALRVNGRAVVIPRLGTAVSAVRGVLDAGRRTVAGALGAPSVLGTAGAGYLLFGACALYYLYDLRRSSGRRDRERARTRPDGTGTDARRLLAGFAALLVVGATAAMAVPAGTQEYGVVSAEFDSERPDVIPAGESASQPYPVANDGFLPAVAYLEPASEGADVRPREVRVGPRDAATATVTLSAPPETGYYRRYVVEHRYLAVLPAPVLDALYRVHPWAPIAAIDALLGGGFYLLGAALVGRGRLRDRSRSRRRPSAGRRGSLPARCRRAIRRFR